MGVPFFCGMEIVNRIPKPFNRLFLLGGWGVAAYAAMKLAGLKAKKTEAPKAPEAAPVEVLKDGIDEGFKSADDAMEQLEEEAKQMFKEADQWTKVEKGAAPNTGDGSLSHAEFTKYLEKHPDIAKTMGATNNKSRKALWKAVETDGEDGLSLAEFTAFWFRCNGHPNSEAASFVELIDSSFISKLHLGLK